MKATPSAGKTGVHVELSEVNGDYKIQILNKTKPIADLMCRLKDHCEPSTRPTLNVDKPSATLDP